MTKFFGTTIIAAAVLFTSATFAQNQKNVEVKKDKAVEKTVDAKDVKIVKPELTKEQKEAQEKLQALKTKLKDVQTQIKDGKLSKEEGDKQLAKIKEEMGTLKNLGRPAPVRPELTKEQKEAQEKITALKNKMKEVQTQIKDGKLSKEDGEKELAKIKEEMKEQRKASRPVREKDETKKEAKEKKETKKDNK